MKKSALQEKVDKLETQVGGMERQRKTSQNAESLVAAARVRTKYLVGGFFLLILSVVLFFTCAPSYKQVDLEYALLDEDDI